MKVLKGFIILFILLIGLTGCSSTNNYMKKDTKEFKKVTNNFVGDWSVNEYLVGGNQYLDNTYESITANFNFGSGTSKFAYVVSEAKIAEKLVEWREKYPDLNVEEYKVVIISKWSLSDKGDILYMDEQNPTLVIKGSGENFTGFYEWERTKFEAAKNAANSVGEGQGLLGLAMKKAAKKVLKKATGTSDLFPKLDTQFNFEFSKDKRNVRIFSIMKTQIRLSKTN